MKRVLVVLMVLGMVASAQAAIQLSINGQTDGPGNVTEITMLVCTTVMIDVQSDSPDGYTAFLDLDDQELYGMADDSTRGEWVGSMNIIRENAGSSSSADPEPFGYLDSWMLNATSFPGETYQTQPGTHFEIVFHCMGLDVAGNGVLITLYDSDFATAFDQIHITQIPEPITMGLLGLGGLFLRRRK